MILGKKKFRRPRPIHPPNGIALMLHKRPFVPVVPREGSGKNGSRFPRCVRSRRILLGNQVRSCRCMANCLMKLRILCRLFRTIPRIGLQRISYSVSILLRPRPIRIPNLFLIRGPRIRTIRLRKLPLFRRVVRYQPSLQINGRVIIRRLGPFPFQIRFRQFRNLGMSFFLASRTREAFTSTTS